MPSASLDQKMRHGQVWLFLGLITLARLVFAAAIPLTDDEAYYRLWAQHLDIGYFDHPPMVAWLIALGQGLLGDTALGIRLGAVLATSLTSLVVHDLALRLGTGRETALTAMVWFNATLIVAAGGMLAVPDVGASLFWTLCLWCLVRAQGDLKRPGLWWALAGLVAGLATLSKYSSLFLAPGIFLWVVVSAERRKVLATPWPWLAGLIAGLVFATNVYWNAQHDWLTFAKQFGRVEANGFSPRFVVELLITQALLLNPLITGFLVRGAFSRKESEPRVQRLDLSLIWLTSLPFAAYLILHALHDRVQGHWPMPLYAGLALAAAVMASRLELGRWGRACRALVPWLGLGLGAAALSLAVAPPGLLPLKRDPTQAVRGWPELASALDAERKVQGAAWVGTVSYVSLAQLSNQPSLQAPVIQITERDRYANAPLPKGLDTTKPGLIIDLSRRVDAKALAACFTKLTPAPSLTRGGRSYAVYRVEGPRVDVVGDGCG